MKIVWSFIIINGFYSILYSHDESQQLLPSSRSTILATIKNAFINFYNKENDLSNIERCCIYSGLTVSTACCCILGCASCTGSIVLIDKSCLAALLIIPAATGTGSGGFSSLLLADQVYRDCKRNKPNSLTMQR